MKKLCSRLEGCKRSMQSDVDFGYKLSICSKTDGNHGKLWSRRPVAGPSGCMVISSQQSGVQIKEP